MAASPIPSAPRVAALRANLLSATERVILEQGVAAVSLRHVARSLGVASGAPYYHFPTRLHLLAALAEAGFLALGGDTTAALARTAQKAPFERLTAVCEAYLVAATARPAHYRVMFLPELGEHPEFGEARRLAEAGLQRLTDVAYGVRPDAGVETARRAAVAAWCAAHGFATLWNEKVVGRDMGPANAAFTPESFGRIAAAAAREVLEG
jgi:AcrR family transcriptional regulator